MSAASSRAAPRYLPCNSMRRDAEAGQAALPRAEQVAFAAQPQIFLGDAEAVFGFAQDREPRLGGLAERRLVEQQAGGMAGPAADAAAQLVQLREPEALGVLDHHDGRLRHVDADLDHGGGDQQLASRRRRKRSMAASFSAPFMRPCTRSTLGAECSDAAPRSALPPRQGRSSRIPRPAGRPNRRACPRRARGRPPPRPRRCATSGMVRVSIGWRPAGFSRNSEISMSPK